MSVSYKPTEVILHTGKRIQFPIRPFSWTDLEKYVPAIGEMIEVFFDEFHFYMRVECIEQHEQFLTAQIYGTVIGWQRLDI